MKLEDWRKKNHLTMAKAAEILGISQPSISRIERGLQWPDKATLHQIAERTGGEVMPNDLAHSPSDDFPGSSPIHLVGSTPPE